MPLSVQLISNADELDAGTIQRWNELAANPFQRWEWLGSWWHAYQNHYAFYVLLVKQGDRILGIAPWCMSRRLCTGRTIEFLGSGKACSDHLSLLCDDCDNESVASVIADWLIDAATVNSLDLPKDCIWDSIELIGADESDERVNDFCRQLEQREIPVEQTSGDGCYIIDLPEQWEDYVKMRSKSGRREIRQSLKSIEEEKIVVQSIRTESELEQFWNDFVYLHQRRRHASGTTGCFDHPPFDIFLRRAASELLKSGMLELLIATTDGKPVATQFAVVDKENWYFYQSGMEPDESKIRPGLSVFCHAIRQTIESGRKRFDMMRGDESYKLRWRAVLHPTQEIRVCSPSRSAQLRNQVYSVGLSFKHMIKSGIHLVQPSES